MTLDVKCVHLMSLVCGFQILRKCHNMNIHLRTVCRNIQKMCRIYLKTLSTDPPLTTDLSNIVSGLSKTSLLFFIVDNEVQTVAD